MSKRQIVLIHGGMTFKDRKGFLEDLRTKEISLEKTRSWSREFLDEELGEEFDIIRPKMPLKENADYESWKIWFERHFEFLRDGVVLIGNSLGGIFLARYLSENEFPKRIASTILVCPPFDDSIPGEDLTNGFELGEDLSLLEKNSDNLWLFFSADDEIVPPSQAEKYKKNLKNANIRIYDDKNGHFFVEEFPEIISIIREGRG